MIILMGRRIRVKKPPMTRKMSSPVRSHCSPRVGSCSGSTRSTRWVGTATATWEGTTLATRTDRPLSPAPTHRGRRPRLTPPRPHFSTALQTTPLPRLKSLEPPSFRPVRALAEGVKLLSSKTSSNLLNRPSPRSKQFLVSTFL